MHAPHIASHAPAHIPAHPATLVRTLVHSYGGAARPTMVVLHQMSPSRPWVHRPSWTPMEPSRSVALRTLSRTQGEIPRLC